jgi:cysteinyl-tRNA synthetase
MNAISELITAFNVIDKQALSPSAVRKCAQWITRMVNTFGLNGATSADSNTIGWSGVSIPEAAKQYVYPLSHLRDELRRRVKSDEDLNLGDIEPLVTRAKPDADRPTSSSNAYADIADRFARDLEGLSSSKTLAKDVLALCDRLRDTDLWAQGIYLEDRDNDQSALVRPVTKELLAQREAKEERERQRAAAKAEREKEAAARAEKGKMDPRQMFRTNEFTQWDESGVPTHDEQGQELAKSRRKKLQKDWERQMKLHDEWLKKKSAA